MTRTHIDIHVLQTVPPSNINRDDTGSPKTATYGGVRRARVSSQAWKRATRVAFESHLDRRDLGERTKRVVEALAEQIIQQDQALADKARGLAAETIKAVRIEVKPPQRGSSQRTVDTAENMEQASYLVFLSRVQIENLASAAITAAGSEDIKTVAGSPRPSASPDYSGRRGQTTAKTTRGQEPPAMTRPLPPRARGGPMSPSAAPLRGHLRSRQGVSAPSAGVSAGQRPYRRALRPPSHNCSHSRGRSWPVSAPCLH